MGGTSVLCAICKLEFDLQQLKDHYIQVHNYEEAKEEKPAVVVVEEKDDDQSMLHVMDFGTLKKKLTAGFTHRCKRYKCKSKFPTAEQRDKHTASHADGTEKPFRCIVCPTDVQFKKWMECCTHYYKVHGLSVGLLKCPICDFRSAISAKIYRHLQSHSIAKLFKCNQCTKRFSKPDLLQAHIENHDQVEMRLKSRWYNQKTCEVCQHSFANSKTLSKHIKQVHNKIKPFICKVCGYSAARKSTITIHERQHTGDRPLPCKYKDCSFRAADPSVLAKHTKKHNASKESEKTYKCPTCKYSTVQTAALKAHIRVKHADVYDAQIKCDLCSFTSVNEKMLARHKLDHKSGLIRCTNDDSSEASLDISILKPPRAATPPQEISSDCFLPLESTDSIVHDPVGFGGVTIPANIEDAQFPN